MSRVLPAFVNPGLLKIELMTRGLVLPAEVRDRPRGADFGSSGHALFGSAADLDLVLPGGTWVSVPIDPVATADSPYRIIRTGQGWAITGRDCEEMQVPVTVRPRSRFFDETTAAGIPFGRIGTVHGPYMALSPTNACTFLDTSDRCRFCGVGAMAATHTAVPIDDIIRAVRIANDEHPLRIVVLSVGHLGGDDGGVRLLEPYVRAIKKHFDVTVAVDALPPSDNGWIDRTYGMGVDAVSYNLELFDPEWFERICPGPARVIGRERFLDALSYATSVFPNGSVTCHLIVGVEPLEATKAGIDQLTALGVLPVLPSYRPFKGRDMRADLPDSTERLTLAELEDLYGHFYKAVRRSGLNVNRVRDIAVVSTPLDARFFSNDEGVWNALHRRVMGSAIGRRTSTVLSDMRRALRVREVSGGPSS